MLKVEVVFKVARSVFQQISPFLFQFLFNNLEQKSPTIRYHHDNFTSRDVYRALLQYQEPRFARGLAFAEVQFPTTVVSTSID